MTTQMTTSIKSAQEDSVLIGRSGHRPHSCGLTNGLIEQERGMFFQRRNGGDGEWVPVANSTLLSQVTQWRRDEASIEPWSPDSRTHILKFSALLLQVQPGKHLEKT